MALPRSSTGRPAALLNFADGNGAGMLCGEREVAETHAQWNY